MNIANYPFEATLATDLCSVMKTWCSPKSSDKIAYKVQADIGALFILVHQLHYGCKSECVIEASEVVLVCCA